MYFLGAYRCPLLGWVLQNIVKRDSTQKVTRWITMNWQNTKIIRWWENDDDTTRWQWSMTNDVLLTCKAMWRYANLPHATRWMLDVAKDMVTEKMTKLKWLW